MDSDSYDWLSQSLSNSDIESLRTVFGEKPNQRLVLANQDAAFNRVLANITEFIRTRLPQAKPVRAVAFNKSQDENWALPWHQDRIISVNHKVDIAGYDNWSRKSGLWHCEPPVDILKDMLAVRVHLDDTAPETGAMEILKGSHTFGKVLAGQTADVVDQFEPVICNAKAGDILIMKMLTLHRSKASIRHAPRRAIRIDYSAGCLPSPLKWEAD